MATGCFPCNYGHAIVLPLLNKKKDASQPKNFRPLSNLCYLSKLLEAVVQKQLQQFLDEHDAMPTHQSAYRKYHSTKTALLKPFNDLLVATDRGLVSGLCLLDLTAAFDTVDHDLLLSQLDRTFGSEVRPGRGSSRTWLADFLFCTRRQNFASCQRDVLGATGFCTRFAVVYFIHSESGRPCLQLRRQSPRVCRWQLVTRALQPQQCVVLCEHIGTVHHCHRPMDNKLTGSD